MVFATFDRLEWSQWAFSKCSSVARLICLSTKCQSWLFERLIGVSDRLMGGGFSVSSSNLKIEISQAIWLALQWSFSPLPECLLTTACFCQLPHPIECTHALSLTHSVSLSHCGSNTRTFPSIFSLSLSRIFASLTLSLSFTFGASLLLCRCLSVCRIGQKADRIH